METLQPVRSPARHPLFQVMLALQNTPPAKLDLPGIAISLQPLPFVISKFDLMFDLSEQTTSDREPQGIEGRVEYSLDLFDSRTVEAIIEESWGGRGVSITAIS